jgi:hypothetical protein
VNIAHDRPTESAYESSFGVANDPSPYKNLYHRKGQTQAEILLILYLFGGGGGGRKAGGGGGGVEGLLLVDKDA